MRQHSVVSAQRRRLLRAMPVWLAAGLACGRAAASTPPLVEVWKDPDCGCCTEWVTHLQRARFATRVHDSGNAAARTRLGIAPAYGSCHTAQVGGYALEGHVPAADIKRLLRDRPKALGLAVPRMPVGSPGMDGPIYAGRRDAFDVLLLTADGRSSVFTTYPARSP